MKCTLVMLFQHAEQMHDTVAVACSRPLDTSLQIGTSFRRVEFLQCQCLATPACLCCATAWPNLRFELFPSAFTKHCILWLFYPAERLCIANKVGCLNFHTVEHVVQLCAAACLRSMITNILVWAIAHVPAQYKHGRQLQLGITSVAPPLHSKPTCLTSLPKCQVALQIHSDAASCFQTWKRRTSDLRMNSLLLVTSDLVFYLSSQPSEQLPFLLCAILILTLII